MTANICNLYQMGNWAPDEYTMLSKNLMDQLKDIRRGFVAKTFTKTYKVDYEETFAQVAKMNPTRI